MIEPVPEAFAFQAFAAAGAVASRAYFSHPLRSGRRQLDRSGSIAAAPWRLAPGFDGFSWSDHPFREHSESCVPALSSQMDLPGHRLSTAVAEPLRNLPTGPKRLA